MTHPAPSAQRFATDEEKAKFVMPEKMTSTAYEKRITSYAADHGHAISRSTAQRMAHQLCKRQARMNDLDLERILQHADPTPRDAIRNIENRRVTA